MALTVDLAVIGAGPGGYVAALRAAGAGSSVALIEREAVGGVCLNVGCIPTKALVASVDLYRRMRQATTMGIEVGNVRPRYDGMVRRAGTIVRQLREGLEGTLRARRVQLRTGVAAFLGPHRLEIVADAGREELEARHVIIATGARARALTTAPFDGKRILSYRHLLRLTHAPKSLLIIGGGVIGCEFASIFAALGTRVAIVEQEGQLLPQEDPEVARRLADQLTQDGAQLLMGQTIARLSAGLSEVTAQLAAGATLTAEYALVAVGYEPNVEFLGLEGISVEHTPQRLVVNEFLQTAQPHIYGIGDCLGGYGLAHVASYDGTLAVENLRGTEPQRRDLRVVPMCYFTHPEIARVGLTELSARSAGTEVKVSRFHFGALGKSQIVGEPEGFVKLIGEAATGVVLGGAIVGYQASTLIHQITLAMHHRLTLRDVARTITAHPTLPEAITEAAQAFYGESVHTLPRSHLP